jgi:hypothetical protein
MACSKRAYSWNKAIIKEAYLKELFVIHILKKLQALHKSKDLPAQHHVQTTGNITPNDYMLAYSIEGHPDLHITHHIFNDLSSNQVKEIQGKIENYFKESPLQPTSVEFKNRLHWGKNKDIPVLTNPELSGKLHPDLKEHWNKLQPSAFPSYVPHVTEDRKDQVKGKISGYYFVQARNNNSPQKIITEVKPSKLPNQPSEIIHHEKPEEVEAPKIKAKSRNLVDILRNLKAA